MVFRDIGPKLHRINGENGIFYRFAHIASDLQTKLSGYVNIIHVSHVLRETR
jgi:hypothetical protein